MVTVLRRSPAHRAIACLALAIALPASAQWGAVDSSFTPGGGRNGGFDNDVFSIGVRPDGKLLVTGFFKELNGISRSGVARLKSDGTLDSTFDPGAGATTPDQLPHTVEVQAAQPDGRVIVGGRFKAYDNVAQPYLARLDAGGSLDESYRPALDGIVVALSLHPNGRLLIGGAFQSVDGVPRNRLARLKPDGSLDVTFDPGSGPDKSVTSVAMQPDGRLLVGGSFTNFNGVPRYRIARLNPSGSLDPTFDPGAGPNAAVLAVAPQPDGRILICGDFTQVGDVPINYMARLMPGGSLDPSFTPDIALSFGSVLTLQLAPDEKVVVGGEFEQIAGTARVNLARLTSTGGLDATFNPGAGPSGGLNPRVRGLALQADGNVIAGGGFTRFSSVDLNRIARLTADQGASVQFASATYETWESNGVPPVITVTRTGSTTGALVVNYAVAGGTATNDYMDGEGAVRFEPGEAQASFSLSVLADAENEPDETVILALGNPIGGAILGSQPTTQLTIHNDPNGTPAFAIRSIAVSGGDATITWDSVPGRTYQVEFKTNLTALTWGNVPGDVPATGPTATKVDAAPKDWERFYRVRRLP